MGYDSGLAVVWGGEDGEEKVVDDVDDVGEKATQCETDGDSLTLTRLSQGPCRVIGAQ